MVFFRQKNTSRTLEHIFTLATLRKKVTLNYLPEFTIYSTKYTIYSKFITIYSIFITKFIVYLSYIYSMFITI